MKRDKAIIALVILLTLSVVGCITAYATLDSQSTTDNRYEVRSDAANTKTLELLGADGKSEIGGILSDGAELLYKETVSYTADKIYDVYADANGNEFRYNKEGKLESLRVNDMTLSTEGVYDSVISEDKAKELACKYASAVFAERLDGFELISAKFVRSPDAYLVTFVKKYGEGGFVFGEYCFVEVFPSGLLCNCSMSDDINFNQDLLDGITKDDVCSYTETQITAQYPSTLKSYEIDTMSLKEINGEFYIIIMANIELNDNINCIRNEYYYALD